MSSGSRFVRSRHGLWLGAVCLLLLAVSTWLAVRFGAPPAVEAGPVARLEAERPPVPSAPVQSEPPPASPPVKRPPVVQPTPPTSPPRQPGPESPPEVVETPAPPPPEEKVLADPFEPHDDQEAPIRTLVAVGDVQLGVIRESARIRDEAGLKKALVRIGDELNQRVVEGTRKQGDPGPQQLLDEHREELGKYMDGMVQVSGPGFMVGTEVGPPLPREKWWTPRKQ